MSNNAVHATKGRIIALSDFLSSRTYVWQQKILERKKRHQHVYAEEVDAAVNMILSYPHIGGKKGALMLTYHQIEYIGQRCYDFVKRQFKQVLFEEMKHRHLERPKVPWHKPIAREYGEIWCADFTHVEFYGMIIYIAVVLDDYAHLYLGHAVSDTADVELVDSAFTMALHACQGALPELCMINDRGSQYKAELYVNHVSNYGINQIFIPKATPWNNGEAEVGMRDIKALMYQRLAHTPRRQGQDIVEITTSIAQKVFKELNEKIPRPKLDGVTPADIVANRSEAKQVRTYAFIEARKAQRPRKKRIDNLQHHIDKKLDLAQWSDRSIKNFSHLLNQKYNLIVPEKV